MADQHFDDDEAPEEVTLNEVIQFPKTNGQGTDMFETQESVMFLSCRQCC